MTKFFISTDFSETAQNATHFALELAIFSKASCTLVHAYKMPYDFAAQMENRVENIKQNSEEKLAKIVHQLKNDTPYSSLQIDYKIEEGSAESVITQLAEESGADLIVMGLSEHSKWDTMMSGNTGIEVIDRSRIPVLAVPHGASFSKPHEIVYAAEYREEDLQNLKELSEWARIFSARLKVIHIAKENTQEEKQRFRGFSEEVVDRLSYPKVSQELIEAEEVEEGILGVAADKEGIILSMAHYHSSVLKNIFGKSHTKAIAMKASVPLMIFFETEE